LVELPDTGDPMRMRAEWIESFVKALRPVGLLDRFQLVGALVTWWDGASDEIRAVAERGFEELLDGWIDIIRDVIEDTESRKEDLFDPFDHKLVRRLLPEYLQEIEDCKLEIARLEDEKTAFEQQGDDEGESEDEDSDADGQRLNYAQQLDAESRMLRASIKEPLERIKFLTRGPNVKDQGSIAARQRLGRDTKTLEAELDRLQARVRPVQEELAAIEQRLAPYEELKRQLAGKRRELKALSKALLDRLDEARQTLSGDDCRELVVDLARADLEHLIRQYTEEHLQQVLEVLDLLWDKYADGYDAIQGRRDAAAATLAKFVEELGYV
jgi:type I restriction enzyme M protein